MYVIYKHHTYEKTGRVIKALTNNVKVEMDTAGFVVCPCVIFASSGHEHSIPINRVINISDN
jgi:hypothetical protein